MAKFQNYNIQTRIQKLIKYLTSCDVLKLTKFSLDYKSKTERGVICA